MASFRLCVFYHMIKKKKKGSSHRGTTVIIKATLFLLDLVSHSDIRSAHPFGLSLEQARPDPGAEDPEADRTGSLLSGVPGTVCGHIWP